MILEEKKQTFRYLLHSIFFDDCIDIEDGRLVDFYDFLMDSLEMRSEIYVGNDSDDYFVIESVIEVLSQFPNIDTTFLFFIIKHPDNFKEMVTDRTGLDPEFIEKAMERLIGDFQEIKQGYLFCS